MIGCSLDVAGFSPLTKVSRIILRAAIDCQDSRPRPMKSDPGHYGIQMHVTVPDLFGFRRSILCPTSQKGNRIALEIQ